MNIAKEKITVNSSAIISILYSYDEKELTVQFVNNKRYLFKEVNINDFISLKYAESIGKYFNRHIKNNYNYELLQQH
jgi:hypothetical protein